MAAGCVPVVINAGGQPEIVTHNKNGFLWTTEKELISLTIKLIKNQKLWYKQSFEAQKRSKDFSKKVFTKKIEN